MTVADLVMAFGGGVFGAALGALPAFVLLGFLIVVGVGVQAAGGGPEFLNFFWGPAFGPHTGGFAAGIAATAYAARRGVLDSGRNVLAALAGLNRPDVLLVGGVFGIVGHLLQWSFVRLGITFTDTIALSIVVSGVIARLLWGNGILGVVPEGESRLKPSQERRWLFWQSDLSQLAVLGLGAGLMSAGLALALGPERGGLFLGFGLSCASLLFLQLGVLVPVSQHITLVAAIAAVGSGSLVAGAIAGVVAALAGELFARLFLIWGDTHIDPAAVSIVVSTALLALVAALGGLGLGAS
jgi:hypothetical protein